MSDALTSTTSSFSDESPAESVGLSSFSNDSEIAAQTHIRGTSVNIKQPDLKSPLSTGSIQKSEKANITFTSSKILTNVKAEPVTDALDNEIDYNEDTLLERLDKRVDAHLGKSSPAFVNSIGSLFLKKTLPILNELAKDTHNSYDFKFGETKKVIFILNDFSRTLGPYSTTAQVFGKISSILQNNLYESNKINFVQLNKLIVKHFSNLSSNHKSFLNELHSIGMTSIPKFDHTTLFDTADEEED